LALPIITNLKYVDYVWDYFTKNLEVGEVTALLDLSSIEDARHSAPDSERLGLRKATARSREILLKSLVARGAIVITPSVKTGSSWDWTTLENWVRDGNSLDAYPAYRGRLGRSIQSILSTDKFNETLLTARQISRHLVPLASEFKGAADAVMDSIRNYDAISEVVVLNGRAPIQAGSAYGGLEGGIKVSYLEHSFDLTSYRIETYETQSRITAQREQSSRLSELNQADYLAAQNWFERNSKIGGSNPFLSGFSPGALSNKAPSLPSATIFLSSADEFVAMDPSEWPETVWGTDQEKAFNRLIPELTQMGFAVNVRMHPNLLNKSWKEFRRVHRAYAKLNANVLGPTSRISSYELIQASDIVLTWGSTIGLEAVKMGKPTWQLGRSYFDLIADVRPLPLTLPSIQDLYYEVRPSSAVRFLAAISSENITVSRALPAEVSESWQQLARVARGRRLLRHVSRLVFFPFLRPATLWSLARNVLGGSLANRVWGLLLKTTLRTGESYVA
jgi:hypothetical protein